MQGRIQHFEKGDSRGSGACLDIFFTFDDVKKAFSGTKVDPLGSGTVMRPQHAVGHRLEGGLPGASCSFVTPMLSLCHLLVLNFAIFHELID